MHCIGNWVSFETRISVSFDISHKVRMLMLKTRVQLSRQAYKQGVNKVKYLCFLPLYYISYSPNLSIPVTNKNIFIPRGLLTFTVLLSGHGSHPGRLQIGCVLVEYSTSTWLAVVIGHSQCSYVNEHLVAFACLWVSWGLSRALVCAAEARFPRWSRRIESDEQTERRYERFSRPVLTLILTNVS